MGVAHKGIASAVFNLTLGLHISSSANRQRINILNRKLECWVCFGAFCQKDLEQSVRVLLFYGLFLSKLLLKTMRAKFRPHGWVNQDWPQACPTQGHTLILYHK